MNKRFFRVATAAVSAIALTAALAACGGDETAQSEEKELTISWYYSSGGGDAWERCHQAIQGAEPGYHGRSRCTPRSHRCRRTPS